MFGWSADDQGLASSKTVSAKMKSFGYHYPGSHWGLPPNAVAEFRCGSLSVLFPFVLAPFLIAWLRSFSHQPEYDTRLSGKLFRFRSASLGGSARRMGEAFDGISEIVGFESNS